MTTSLNIPTVPCNLPVESMRPEIPQRDDDDQDQDQDEDYHCRGRHFPFW